MVLEGYPENEPLGGFEDKGRGATHVSTQNRKNTAIAYSVRIGTSITKYPEYVLSTFIRNHAGTCRPDPLQSASPVQNRGPGLRGLR